MNEPLLVRITETVARAHDVNLELLELADELRDYASRATKETERLQKGGKGGLDAAVLKLPRVLASGPIRREEASAAETSA